MAVAAAAVVVADDDDNGEDDVQVVRLLITFVSCSVTVASS